MMTLLVLAVTQVSAAPPTFDSFSGVEIRDIDPSGVIPVSVDGRSLAAAIVDASFDIPLRVAIEQCSPNEALDLHLDTHVNASAEEVLDALLAAYTSSGGRLQFTSETLDREAYGAELEVLSNSWTVLKEVGCDQLLDEPIDFEYSGTDANEALTQLTEALAVAKGEPVVDLTQSVLKARWRGPGLRLEPNSTGRQALQQILDRISRENTEFSWIIHPVITDGEVSHWVESFPVQAAPKQAMTREHGPLWTVDGKKYRLGEQVVRSPELNDD